VTLIGSQRRLFDIPDGIAYFNTAYIAPLLNASRDRLVAGAAAKSRPWERAPADFFADAERIRQLAAELFGGDADGYAIVPAASYGLSAAARAIEPTLGRGDRIVLMAEEFPSNVLPWRRVAQQTGAVVRTVAVPRDGDGTAAVLAELEHGASVAALSPCHWTNGSRLDLTVIGRACRAAEIALVLDATQFLGAAPIDLAAADPAFLVSAGYKWLLAPYGFGLAYVAPRWRDARPLEETWLARTGAENFAGLVNYSDTYMAGARRFDVGEKCTTTLLPGAIAALEQIRDWTIAGIGESLAAINARIQRQLEALGFALPPPNQRCPHMFGAELPDGVSGDIVGGLRKQGVYVSQRGSAIRFAPHLHVTETDIEQLLTALDEVLGTLKRH
jgi:selenocysteine lyase/cysteine desulfurase